MEGTTINLIIMTVLVLWGLHSLWRSWFKQENRKDQRRAKSFHEAEVSTLKKGESQ